MARVISMFNNKGGVGKSTLSFHLAHALAELGHRVLMVDFDPQCNLTIYCMETEHIHRVWGEEDDFIGGAGFEITRNALSGDEFARINKSHRTVHYLLKPTEDGTADLPSLPPPVPIADNLDLLPGRLTLHLYEAKIASRWNDLYAGDPLAIKTVTRLRSLVDQYAAQHSYDFVVVDTSPSLGALNKVAISTVDAFIIPCLPDMFSLYGIRNIGQALAEWKRQFDTIFQLVSDEKRARFPEQLVRFIGFTIYNAKRREGSTPWNMAQAHYNYAKQIPQTIIDHMPSSFMGGVSEELMSEPIGSQAVMHTHNTYPSHAQKYRVPIWKVPEQDLDTGDRSTVSGNRERYIATQGSYHEFARAVVARLSASLG